MDRLIARVRRDVTAVIGPQGMRWTREPLTEARLADHLSGGTPRGVGLIEAGSSVTSAACLDLDSHKGETPWQEMVAALQRVVAALRERELEPVVWRSRGGRGIHVWILWERPQSARAVRAVLRAALSSAGYRAGTKGVKAGQIELFPKQDRVPAGGYGNQVILPGSGHSARLVEALGWAPGGPAEADAEWALNSDLGPDESGESGAAPIGDWSGAGVAADQLAQLLSLSPLDVDDYDDWTKAGMICHAEAAGESWGLELWQEWSQASAKYPGAEALASKWASFGRRDGPLVTARSLGTLPARPGDFEDEGAAAEVAGEPEPLRVTRDKKGRIEATLPNLSEVLRRWDLIGWRIQWDAFLGCEVLTIGEEPRRLATDADVVAFRERLERGGGVLGPGFKAVGRELMRDAILRAAQEDAVDSAIEWLESSEQVLGWDGVPRVDTFLTRYLGAADTEYVRAVSRYLWTALVGRVMDPGCQADMAPILIGPQGAGKSTAVQMLAPDPRWFADIGLSDQKDADLSRRMRGVCVIELGELSGLRAKDREWLKAFVTRRVERWTPKYQERETIMPRRCVFIGTTNERALFSDATGERRWLPVEVGTTDRDALCDDVHQLWLEGLALWRAEGIAYEDAERLGRGEHEQFRDCDPWEETVLAWLRGAGDDGQVRGEAGCTIQEIWCGAIGGVVTALSRGSEMRISQILRATGARRERSQVGKNRKWVWRL